MKRRILSILAVAAAVGSLEAAGVADRKLASVNGDPVMLRQLESDLAGTTNGDPWQALERRINVTLVVQEAGRMGLDESLEVRDQLGVFERDTLRDGLFATRVASIRPDAKAVADLERAMATEVSIRSMLFPKEADAKALAAVASHGADFEAAMKDAAAKGQGRIDEGEGFIKSSELRPEIVAAVAKLKPGETSPAYALGDQFAVTRLIDRKIVQDAALHAAAEAEALRRAQLTTITAFVDELRTKYATVDTKLLASVDFDGKDPGFEALLKDKRPVAAIAGEAPITVADVAGALKKRLFHGSEQAGGRGKLNHRKGEILDDLIAKRVVMKEAKRLGLDTKPAYVAIRDEERKELMFGAFVAKVLAGDVAVTDDEIAAYYKSHAKEFTEPDMMRLDALAFDSRASAEAALAKLHAGADVTWMKGNAAGRIDASAVPEAERVPSAPVIKDDLPPALRDALAGARAGDLRLYTPSGGAPTVVLVKDVFAGKTQPLAEVTGGIRARLSGQKRQQAFEAYAAKLRAASDVKLFVTAGELKTLVGDKKAAL